jgi:DNA-binding MarR family transcriptional regulator
MENGLFQTELKDIAALDQVIHTPARLMTVMLLNQVNSLDFIQLMSLTDLTWGNLSTHLSKLEEAGYVMITKTFKGKRPQTLISITEAGRQAYLQWGYSIIKALPQKVKYRFIQPAADKESEIGENLTYIYNAELPQTAQRDVFFLPRYHRWGMELPPAREFNPFA